MQEHVPISIWLTTKTDRRHRSKVTHQFEESYSLITSNRRNYTLSIKSTLTKNESSSEQEPAKRIIPSHSLLRSNQHIDVTSPRGAWAEVPMARNKAGRGEERHVIPWSRLNQRLARPREEGGGGWGRGGGRAWPVARSAARTGWTWRMLITPAGYPVFPEGPRWKSSRSNLARPLPTSIMGPPGAQADTGGTETGKETPPSWGPKKSPWINILEAAGHRRLTR